jgi:hypothetical protein
MPTATQEWVVEKAPVIPRPNASGRQPDKWEEELSGLRDIPGTEVRVFSFDREVSAKTRAHNIKARWEQVFPMEKVVTKVRALSYVDGPETDNKGNAIPVPAPDTKWGVWVAFYGEMTPAERQARDQTKARRAQLARERFHGGNGAKAPAEAVEGGSGDPELSETAQRLKAAARKARS